MPMILAAAALFFSTSDLDTLPYWPYSQRREVSPTQLPFWTAQELGIFEKFGPSVVLGVFESAAELMFVPKRGDKTDEVIHNTSAFLI